MLIDRTLYDLVYDPHADALFFPAFGYIGNILPAAADIYFLSVPGMTDILTAFLHFGEPFLFAFGSAKIPFDDEPGTVLDQDSKFFSSIIA